MEKEQKTESTNKCECCQCNSEQHSLERNKSHNCCETNNKKATTNNSCKKRNENQ